MKIFGINFFVFCIILLSLVLYFTKEIRDEGFFISPGVLDQSTEAFGTSPGTLVQLASTHVENDTDDEIYNNLTRQGIINMTESGYNDTNYASTHNLY